MKNTTVQLLKLARAQALCIDAHTAAGQVRKYTGEPYWTHPLEVAELIRSVVPSVPVDVLAAAMLHDVVDDTAVTLQQIEQDFGPDVAQMVWDLSDQFADMASGGKRPNRAERKAMERAQIDAACPWSKTIRLADVIRNLQDIAARDPAFAKVYFVEKRLLLPHLAGGDPTLLAMATALVDDYFASVS